MNGELELIKKQIIQKQQRLYYILNKEKLNTKRREYQRQSWNERADKTNKINEPLVQKILYILKTNKKVTIGEMVSFGGTTRNTVIMIMSIMRKQGHQIKYSKLDGFYYYGGKR